MQWIQHNDRWIADWNTIRQKTTLCDFILLWNDLGDKLAVGSVDLFVVYLKDVSQLEWMCAHPQRPTAQDCISQKSCDKTQDLLRDAHIATMSNTALSCSLRLSLIVTLSYSHSQSYRCLAFQALRAHLPI